jgi:tetratricopeptide (TPR) repeat protein
MMFRWLFAVACLAPVLVVADEPQASAPVVASRPEEIRHLAPMSFNEARDRTFTWSLAVAGTQDVPQQVRDVWANVEPGIPARGIHDLVIRSFAELDEPTRELLAALDLRNPPVAAPDLGRLERSSDPFYRSNLQLTVARLLAEARLYDEALALYEQADVSQAVDPATAQFFKAVCEHQLLRKKEGLATLEQLLEQTDAVPESYTTVALLMRSELEALKDDSLDEIAAMMRDVKRQLELARGGQRVQKKEDEIASKLDEMIKKAEEQMQKASKSSSGNSSGGSNQPNNPLGDSIVKGSTAPGQVDPKDVRPEGDWGDMPRREREQAKNEMERAFPSNYGRLINEYFLKRTRGDQPPQD